MEMKIPLLVLITLISFLPLLASSQFVIKVGVKEIIKGNMAYINITSKPFLKIYGIWENVGSLGCEVRMRVDFYNNGELIHTAWSNSEPVWPGGVAELTSYWFYPTKDKLTARIRIYACNEIFEYGTVEIKTEEINPERGILGLKEIRTYEDYIEVKIKSKIKLNNVFIIPKNYPTTWIFESEKIDVLENEKWLKIRYEPTIWEENNLTLVAITEDGKFFDEKTFLMKKERIYNLHIFIIAAILFIILIISPRLAK